MISLKKCVFSIFLLFLISLLSPPLYGADNQAHKASTVKAPVSEQSPVYPPMPEPGKKVPIGGDRYIVYGLDKKPKLGTVIMKVQVFTKEGQKDTSFEVKADAGMPSMKGAHETGDKPFILSNKGDYLLPINIVMPGDWEIRLTIVKEGRVIFRGRYNFDV